MKCEQVLKLKKRWMFTLLLYTFSPLLIALTGGLLGFFGLITNELVYAFEFAAWYLMFTLVTGSICMIFASIFFSRAEKKCGIVPKFNLLWVASSSIIGFVIFIILVLYLSEIGILDVVL